MEEENTAGGIRVIFSASTIAGKKVEGIDGIEVEVSLDEKVSDAFGTILSSTDYSLGGEPAEFIFVRSAKGEGDEHTTINPDLTFGELGVNSGGNIDVWLPSIVA